MRIIGNDPSVPRQEHAVASGTLTNGTPVVVNSDGTVSAAASSTISDASTLGATISGRYAENAVTVYHAAADRIVTIVWNESNNNVEAYAGTISTSTISYGSAATISGYTIPQSAVYDPSTEKIVLLLPTTGGALQVTSLTVSGTTVTWSGNYDDVDGQGGTGQYGDISYDTVNEVCVIAFFNRYNRITVRTYQSSDRTLGTYKLPNGTSDSGTRSRDIIYDDNIGRHIVVFDTAATTLKYSIISVSAATGDNITFTSPATFSLTNLSGISDLNLGVGYDQNSNFVIVAYQGSSNYGTLRAFKFTTSGIEATTNVLVYKSEEVRNHQMVYSPAATKVYLAYRLDGNDQDYSGTTLSNFSDGSTVSASTAFDVGTSGESETNAIQGNSAIAYVTSLERIVHSVQNFNSGSSSVRPIKSFIVTQEYNSTNLTSENYIGIARSGAADTAGAIIDTQGAIADNLSGLTAGQSYYVQTDGTLGTTADDPSVFAGTAVSATKLIVKG